MLNKFNPWILVMFLFSTFIPAVSLGYEEIDVKAGGTLTGKVTLKDSPPQARIFHLITSPNMDFCGKISDGKGNRLLEEFSIDEKGGFNNVVVLIVGIEKGKPFNYTPDVTVQNCQISPFVTPVRNHHAINLINHDPVIHDVQTYTLKDQYTFAMFNKPLTPKETVVKQVKFRPGHYIFRVQCGVHAFMQSWGIGVGNPYFTVTSNNGTFSISDIPPGEYDVIAWHPLMDPSVQRIKIPSDGKIEASFEFNSQNVHIPEHDLQTGYRFDTALLPEKIPAPTILPQRSRAAVE
ncbi:MAG: carboxypeptidase regulatory-like domain-containing protein [Nitrospirae bacterium]|nr:carboxypeptidase regulatory-like domain-containing protein [Nitrospirota bacterium]